MNNGMPIDQASKMLDADAGRDKVDGSLYTFLGPSAKEQWAATVVVMPEPAVRNWAVDGPDKKWPEGALQAGMGRLEASQQVWRVVNSLSEMATAIDKMKAALPMERQKTLNAALQASNNWHKEARCEACMLNFRVQAHTMHHVCNRCASELLPTWEMQTARWSADETAEAMLALAEAVGYSDYLFPGGDKQEVRASVVMATLNRHDEVRSTAVCAPYERTYWDGFAEHKPTAGATLQESADWSNTYERSSDKAGVSKLVKGKRPVKTPEAMLRDELDAAQTKKEQVAELAAWLDESGQAQVLLKSTDVPIVIAAPTLDRREDLRAQARQVGGGGDVGSASSAAGAVVTLDERVDAAVQNTFREEESLVTLDRSVGDRLKVTGGKRGWQTAAAAMGGRSCRRW